ncbi:uncharacterized protein LOC132282047 [Cornus florida]|uniref:uncharacterized protein LOC132282047 n=1 Tax=Cornus florida TaxID=4283 RepID=UPI0028A01E04|nr:uncharacterized protein LOC132282047 [Cornus florida]
MTATMIQHVFDMRESASRQIWKARNAWVFEQKWWDAMEIVRIREAHCFEFLNCNVAPFATIRSHYSGQNSYGNPVRWQAPPVDMIKVNTDASFCEVLYPLVAEGLVFRKVMDQVIRWGYSHIVFEIDAEVIVEAAMLDGSSSLLLGPLVEDIREWLHHHPDFDLVYMPRVGNELPMQLLLILYKRKVHVYGMIIS